MINIRKLPDTDNQVGHAKSLVMAKECVSLDEFVTVKSRQGPTAKNEDKNKIRQEYAMSFKNSFQALQ